MSLRFLFRVDAAQEIGSGHVMRCLCLADALKRAGHESIFVSRQRAGNLIDLIEARGFRCHALPATENAETAASWLGAEMATEIEQSRAVITQEAPDWLVFDHYAMGEEVEKSVTPQGTRVLVIDDLADRPHACDLLLDTGLVHHASDYEALVSHHCRLILGPTFALLGPQFAGLREKAGARERRWPPARILVNLGGIDRDNLTTQVLDTLDRSDLADATQIDVVMGGKAPHIEAVRAQAAASRLAVHVSVGVTDMAERMLAADLAVGAAGTTAWERACLGLPSLMISIADNQRGVARALEQVKAAVDLGPMSAAEWPSRLLEELGRFALPERMVTMSAACLALVDGRGTERVLAAIEAPPLALRACIADDAENVWQWREADEAYRFYRSARPTPWEDHQAWFARAIGDPARQLWIVEEEGRPVAHLRFDVPANCGPVPLSICLAPETRGRGLGVRVLSLAERHAASMGWQTLEAEVHRANTASRRVFERSGYIPVGEDAEFLRYERTV